MNNSNNHSKVSGWALEFLNSIDNGLLGHVNKYFYPFNTNCWAKLSFQDGGMEGWWPYEQAAYYIDGRIKASYYSGNDAEFNKLKNYIDEILSKADADGFIGARDLKKQGLGNQWVHAVFFRAVLFLYNITDEKKYLECLTRHYFSGNNTYDYWREAVNIENILNIYIYTKNKDLLNLAEIAYENFNKKNNPEVRISDFMRGGAINLHAVTYNELAKLPAIFYLATGEEKYLSYALKAYDRIFKNHMLINGMHSCCENFKGRSALDAIETCDISDFTWGLSYLAEATNDVEYWDLIERICYNVAPSIWNENCEAMQYFSSLNQVVSTRYSNHSKSFTQTPRMAYQPNHYPECCTGNAYRAIPNFIYNSIKEKENYIEIRFYIPGNYIFKDIEFEIETEYPYDEKISIYCIKGSGTIKLRIPLWCEKWNLSGFSYKQEGNWIYIDLTEGKKLDLCIKSKVEFIENEEGCFIQKQPLLYTLDIPYVKKYDKVEPRQNERFKSFNYYPDGFWQIALDKSVFMDNMKFINFDRTDGLLFSEKCPFIVSKGYIIEDYDILKKDTSEIEISDYDKGEIVKLRDMGQLIYEGMMELTPSVEDAKNKKKERLVDIKLRPYSTAILRWTVFPVK